MKYHGIVISLTKGKAIVITRNFEYFYIKRNPTSYIGKIIEFTKKDIIKTKSRI
ncbi:MAG: anti-sigma factor domain-containing protein [Bacillota bacterium]|nr:anti-sigma factor domain-containing protein [Bacillota bacterium]